MLSDYKKYKGRHPEGDGLFYISSMLPLFNR